MLEKFRVAKQAEIQSLRKLAAAGNMPLPFSGTRPPFCGSLSQREVPVIAEYKRASPSRGDINLGIGPEATAAHYEQAGAGAISVLTEERYFKGDLAYLERMAPCGLPLLRKDFILDPLQMDATAATPASAVLLIVRMLDAAMLPALIGRAGDLGLEAVVEVFDEADLVRAKKAGARIIQVNNRDLDRLELDLTVSRHLVTRKSRGEFWITASGISKGKELRELLDLGFDAALVGSSLMQGEEPGSALSQLISEAGSRG